MGIDDRGPRPGDVPSLDRHVGPLVILVVDDEDGSRAVMTLALRRAGFEVLEASSGAAALEIVASGPVDLIVSDVGMPGMSGIDLVEELRSHPDTETLPIILVTGSGDDQSVIEGLGAGADDFLAKPIRLDELLARVRAQLRTHAAWVHVLQDELRIRSGVVAALGGLTFSAVPEEAAEAVVAELADRAEVDFVSVAQVAIDGRMHELATYNRVDGLRRGGELFPADLAGYLLGRARDGPWVDEVAEIASVEPTDSFQAAGLELVASAPLFSADDLIGLLSIGTRPDPTRTLANRQARLLSAAIDYASALESVAGSAIAGRRDAAAMRARLEAMLKDGAFYTVLEPIIDLETQVIAGYEALTRFDDGMPPDGRFLEAARVDLGAAFELAALAKAIEAGRSLPPELFLTVNVSPQTVIEDAMVIRGLLRDPGRSVVVEVTEHVAIEDYGALRAAFAELGDHVHLAVDDAGAGYASLRHILELRPTFAKLDISLVRDIDGDELRQAMAAGLNYFALRTGCRLIAEGIETDAEAAMLLSLGIEFGQGYLFGRPVRPGE